MQSNFGWPLLLLTAAISTVRAQSEPASSERRWPSGFDQLLPATKSFDFFWNVPSFMCRRYKIKFLELDQFGIIQNTNDTFRGDQIVILYDPGKFPALLLHNNTLYRRNGGVPQEGDLQEHIDLFASHVNEQIPNEDFDGIAVIDFESWRPIFRQNMGVLKPYQDLSTELVRLEHPFWPKRLREKEAKTRFERAAQLFMGTTIKVAKYMRPKAKWGYYGLPYCFNMNGQANMEEDCKQYVQEENDQISWLWELSDVILPSVYLREKRLNADQRIQLVKGRIREAHRLAQRVQSKEPPPVYAYIRYVYTDTKDLLNNEDMKRSIEEVKNLQGNGVIFWGSSYDLKEEAQCRNFYEYLQGNLGPLVHNFKTSPVAIQIQG